jgi:CRP-like cAMP-binding protein
MEKSWNRLLANLAAPNFALLARHFKRAPLEQGAVLQEQGAPVNFVYFPLSGAVSLLLVMQSGEAVETTVVGREGAIGLFADFGPWQACTRATVQAPGIAESIPSALFKAVASHNEDILHLMLCYKETLSAQTQQSVACNALHSVEARVARWLLELSDRIESAELPVTQDVLSQMLGVRRTTVTLIAQKLKHDGMISYRRGRIVITDRAAIERLACECYAACRRRSESLFEDAHLARAPA